MDKNICPRCKAKDPFITNYREGEIVCTQCGYVLEIEFVDEHLEERNFSKNCSSKGLSKKDISRISGPVSSYSFGNNDEVKILGHKRKFNIENYPNINNKINDKNLSEKEKKILRRNANLNKIDIELKKICTFFNISKMIYEETKELAIKLYDYGKIHLRTSIRSKLVLGLLINYNLKNKTNTCFSKEEISSYFKCDIETIKKEIEKIYPILQNCNTIADEQNITENNINNDESKMDTYLKELQKTISFLIRSTKIKTITGILDSYDILYLYIINKIFNIETIPPICLAGGALIFCIKLYGIEFTIVSKSKDRYDESYSMDTPENTNKLVNYIARKCSHGIKTDKLLAIYNRMVKHKDIIKDEEKYKNFLNNLL